ncbi:MAG: hypothetical protein PHX21_12575 [bacterium]|nr:hypothetical protein [bacterium]
MNKTLKLSSNIKIKEDKVKKILTLGLSLVFVFGIIGCGKEKPVDEQAADKVAVEDMVRASAWFQSDASQTDNTDTTTQKGKGNNIIGTPLWGRAVADTGNHLNISISVTGDSAYVEWTLDREGLFVILGQEEVVGDSGLDTIGIWPPCTKSLSETSKMYGVFKRTGSRSSTNRGWTLRKISGVSGYSNIKHTVRIDSMRIQCKTYPDTVLTNPSGYLFDMENALNFAPAESITITLYTNTSNAEAYLHLWPEWLVRIPMKNNGDGTFTNEQKWCIPFLPQITRFAWFDLIGKSTIHDTQDSYDYDGWLYPYLNKNI